MIANAIAVAAVKSVGAEAFEIAKRMTISSAKES